MKIMLSKALVLAVIVLFVGANIVPNVSSDVSISNAGNTLYVGGSGAGNYTTIQSAIDDASDGDTIFVYNGIYSEKTIKVNKSINLIGENKEFTIIGYVANTNDGQAIIIKSPNVTIEGFTVKNARTQGIRVTSDYVLVKDVIAKNNLFGDIEIFEANYCDIVDCISHGQKFRGGFILLRANYCNIRNCTAYNNIYNGVHINHGNYNKLYNITTINCKRGFNLYFKSKNNTIENCVSYDSYNGFFLTYKCMNNTFVNCKTYNNSGSGFYLEESDNNHVVNCHIEESDMGVFLNKSNNCNVSKSNFIFNNNHAIFKYSNGNLWRGNYWDDCRGFLPKPIKGKIKIDIIIKKIEIPWLNFDWNPVKEPYDIHEVV
jgi:nitrous oxidase accessory protein